MQQEQILYTFIMDYLGGTYISQHKSYSKEDAMKQWIEKLDVEQVEDFTIADKQKLIEEDFAEETPSLIDGMTNVWCFTIRTKKGFAIVNYIKTAL